MIHVLVVYLIFSIATIAFRKFYGNNIDVDPKYFFSPWFVILNGCEPKVDARRG